MNTRLTCRQRSAGFAPSGCLELLLLSYIVSAVLNLAFGHWIIGTAMLVLLAGLFFWTRHMDRRNR